MMQPTAPPVPRSTAGGTVLITGSSSGIGLATVIAAARAGWNTVATVRDPERADRLHAWVAEAGVDIDVRRLDVTDPGSIHSCLQGVLADHGRWMRWSTTLELRMWGPSRPTTGNSSVTAWN